MEVLVSVVILGLVAAALLGGMTTTVASSNIGRQQADAATVLTSASEAVSDPTLYQYQCPAPYVPIAGLPTLPVGWSWTVKTEGQWDGSTSTFQSACNGNMQLLTITVTNGQLTWSRQVVKRAS